MRIDVPEQLSKAVPDPARLARTRESITGSLKPVRSLPSNAVLMTVCLVVFALLAVALAMPAGLYGFAKLTVAGRWAESAVVLLLALMLAGSVVEQLIPGSRRTMSPVAGAMLAVFLLSVTAYLLFPDFTARNFVRRGTSCLKMGTLSAIPAGALIWAMMRRGFVTDPVSAAIAGGSFAGLLGVGVLSLHCPIFTAAHIIAWHVTVIVVTSLVGAVIGWALSRFR